MRRILALAVTGAVMALATSSAANAGSAPNAYLFSAWAENAGGTRSFVSRWFQPGDVAWLVFRNGYAQPFAYRLCIERGKRKLVCWAPRKARPLGVDRITYAVDLPPGLNVARWYVKGRPVAAWPI